MAWWGSLLSLSGALITLIAGGCIAARVAKEHGELLADKKEANGLRAERGQIRDGRGPDAPVSPREVEIDDRLRELGEVLTYDMLERLSPRDLHRAVIEAEWKVVRGMGAVSLVGGAVALVGALLTVLATE